MTKSCTVLSMDVGVTHLDAALSQVEAMAQSNNGAYVCVSNVHMCMEVFDCSVFSQIVNNADLVIPDGRPLSFVQRLMGHKDAKQVRGQDIMNAICQTSGDKKINIGFYGGSSDALLERVKEKLKISYPDIQITFSYSPPYRPLTDFEDRTIVQEIISCDVNVLFVGIGCPKQERWMAEHKNKLNCVMLGVGAAFDFIAGSKNHAPRWMQKLSLEWLFRLCSEPTRLWKRYLKHNPRFVYHSSKQVLKHKLASRM